MKHAKYSYSLFGSMHSLVLDLRLVFLGIDLPKIFFCIIPEVLSTIQNIESEIAHHKHCYRFEVLYKLQSSEIIYIWKSG